MVILSRLTQNDAGSKLKQKYVEVLDKFNDKKEIEKKCSRTVELFFSFDIVNSTSYKDTNYFGWQIVLTAVLTNIKNSVAKEIPEAQLWRVLGDEIIFFVTIKNMEEIYASIDSIYRVLTTENAKLRNGNFLEDKDQDTYNKNDIMLMKSNKILAVQAAAWLAIIISNNDKSYLEPYENIFTKYYINENQQINEFLGHDIDTGFRIKKETQNRRLVVSIELAKILSERTEYLSRLHIITYKCLKGVWDGRLYPIIWYHDAEINGGVSFEDSFFYDEAIYSQMSKEYFQNRNTNEGALTSYMFSDVYRALNKIIKDQQLEDKMNRTLQIIEETENDLRAVENEFNNHLLEFHCAAVCCDVKNRRILIAKRKNRKILSGLWEFGCAKAKADQNLCDSIIKEYKNDFGIDIEIVCDETRDEKQPKPLALYQVNKFDRLQKGVIVAAKLIGGQENMDNAIRAKGKHEEYKWISKEEIQNYKENIIPDFQNTLNLVFQLWSELFKEET